MRMPVFERYIDELIEKSTLDVPVWNIEKARAGKGAGWNYIDGCMILALLEIYQATGEKKYYEFADAFIDPGFRKMVLSTAIRWKSIILTM